jgi:cytochrome c-type biogenesis protein CcmH
MGFWLVALALAIGAAAILLRTAADRTTRNVADEHPDMAIYRAQLAEVDRDLARGIIGAPDATPLRNEIARRILDLDRQTRQADAAGMRPGGLAVPALCVAAALAGSFALYDRLGAPGYSDLPHAARIAAADRLMATRPSQADAEVQAARTRPEPPAPSADYATLMDQLRAAVANRPNDVQGLRLLAENESRLGNLSAAATAMAQLVAAMGPDATADDHAALADAYILAAGGLVTAAAEAEINAALGLDPTNGTARFYAGLLQAQTGRPDRAFALWRDLLENGPQAAPWVPFIRERIASLADAAGVDYAPPAANGPDAAAVAAAGDMSPADRAKMISGMVDGLEQRLATQSGSAAEWAQLLTALGVLGDKDRAQAAWASAQTALASDPAGLDQVRAAATKAGVAQ